MFRVRKRERSASEASQPPLSSTEDVSRSGAAKEETSAESPAYEPYKENPGSAGSPYEPYKGI